MKADWITKLFVLLLLAETVAFVLSFRFGDLIWSGVGAVCILCWIVVLFSQTRAADPERIKRRNRAWLYYTVIMDLYLGLGFLVERFVRRDAVGQVIDGAAFVVVTICLALLFLIKQRQRRSGGNSGRGAGVS